jgi:SAM-dependent methyltransferase
MTEKIGHQIEYWESERKRRSPEHPVVDAFVMPKINYIRDYVDLSGMSILDVGCGNGFFTYYFSKLAYTVGIDYSRHMLSINPCDLLIQGSALALPLKTDSFDLFMALFSVLVHEERGTLKFSLQYLKKLAVSSGLNIVDACLLGSIVPNKTPLSLLDLFKKIDKKSLLGFYSIVLACK